MKNLVALPLLLGLGACGDPMKDGQLLEEARALGVRIETESGRSTPELGEEVAVSFLFAGPNGPVDLRVAYEICLATDSARGVPSCIETPYLEGVLDLDDSETPSFVVPDDAPLGARAVVHAVGCEEGEPTFASDPIDWRCEGGGEPLSVSFDFWIYGGEVHNENPDLSALTIDLEGEDVSLQDPNLASECTPDTPRVSPGQTHEINLNLGQAARESLPSGELEILQISHFSTAGLLERQFSIVDGSEGAEVSVPWEGPEEPGPVKHYAVVRDGRGGVTWVSFDVCVD